MKKKLFNLLVIFLIFLSPHFAYAAIARDSIDAGLFNNDGSSTTFTLAHTDTGSNLTLVVTVVIIQPFGITGVTYNGVAMTLSSSKTTATTNRYNIYVFTMINPPTGTHNIVLTIPSPIGGTSHQMTMQGISYTGTLQTGIDSSNTTIIGSTASPATFSTTVVASGSWITGAAAQADGFMGSTPGSGTTYPGSQVGNFRAADSNGTVGTGSQSLIYSLTSTGEVSGAVVSLAPAPAAVTVTSSIVGLVHAILEF